MNVELWQEDGKVGEDNPECTQEVAECVLTEGCCGHSVEEGLPARCKAQHTQG